MMASKWSAQQQAPGEPEAFDPANLTCAPDLTDADVNFDARNFFLRDELESEDRLTRAANLRALGDTVAIYVDEETPMDIDLDCSDPNNPIQPPYIIANLVADGANISFLHLISECVNEDVHIGQRVQALWKPEEEWDYAMDNIQYFRPIDEPDVPVEMIGKLPVTGWEG